MENLQIIDVLKCAYRDHINTQLERNKVKKNSIKYILLGGGSNIDIYNSTTKIAANRHTPKLNLIKASKPKELSPADVTDDDWSRLIVAFGLAHGIDAFPNYMGDAEIYHDEDLSSNPNDFRKNYIGPEQM